MRAWLLLVPVLLVACGDDGPDVDRDAIEDAIVVVYDFPADLPETQTLVDRFVENCGLDDNVLMLVFATFIDEDGPVAAAEWLAVLQAGCPERADEIADQFGI